MAISRISKFLDEDEVSDEVSALKSTSLEDDELPGLTIENGSFKWNELEQKDPTTNPSGLETSTLNESHFELKDISISFPEGKLTCVVGPTAR